MVRKIVLTGSELTIEELVALAEDENGEVREEIKSKIIQ